RRRWAGPAAIGAKALAVNVSDIAAMGGLPRWALVGLGCPDGTGADEVEAFYEGAVAVADEHGVAIIGGDTSASPAGWLVSVTLLGEAVRPVLRSTARPGDVIAVTDTLDVDPVDWATGGGEDYELLVVCDPVLFARLRDGLADATGTALTAVGEIMAGSGTRWLDGRGRAVAVAPGFEHFRG